ncbi:MAG: hypothetical protein MZV65_45800 [Chromatiales bacterium]|nr:hypothetical protein [Chromatiales bacterium]MCK7582205.1 hypothetical protein [Chromatiales bacterium]
MAPVARVPTRSVSPHAPTMPLPALKDVEQRRTYVSNLTPADQQPFSVPGYCQPCRRQVALQVDFAYAYPVDGRLQPNWRERLVCPHCRLNSRIRATLHLFERFVGADAEICCISLSRTRRSIAGWRIATPI